MSSMKYDFILSSEKKFLEEFGQNQVTSIDEITNTGYDIDGGLLDQRIFGPRVSYACKCGRTKGMLWKNHKCPDCKTLITDNLVRFKNYGYIKLPIPIIVPIFKTVISKILGIRAKEMELLSTGGYVLFYPNDKAKIRIPIDTVDESTGEITSTFTTGYIGISYTKPDNVICLGRGTSTMRDILLKLDRQYLIDHEYNPNIKTVIEKTDNLQDFFMTIVTIIPPGYREALRVGKMLVVDSLNIYYKSIMMKINRIEFLMNNDPEYETKDYFWNEVRVLESIINGLFFGGMTARGKSIKSYAGIIDTKGGMVRSGLLGMRSMFSARSVLISCKPDEVDLALNELLVPYDIAKNLLTLHIIKVLRNEYGKSHKESLSMIKDNTGSKENELVKEIIFTKFDSAYYVYFNRAPSLYRHSYMGFLMKINPGLTDKTIKIHPLTNSAFNADYDGDTGALHLSLSGKAQLECKTKATFQANPYYDKTGDPAYEFSQEFVYGLWYATNPAVGHKYNTLDECEYYCDSYHNSEYNMIVTKGWTILNDVFKSYEYDLNQYYDLNKSPINKSIIKNISKTILNESVDTRSISLLRDIMNYAAEFVTESGLSLNFDDFKLVDKTELTKSKNRAQFQEEETKLVEKLKSHSDYSNNLINIVRSGAKGNYSQIKQLMIAKGVLIDAKGELTKPIFGSISDGLNKDEIIQSVLGSRKGLIDKSISTAVSGYFEARLTKGLRNIKITQNDCGTTDGFLVPLTESEGRFTAESIGKISANTLMTRELINSSKDYLISKNLPLYIKVRSPIQCHAVNEGVCRKCFGKIIARDKLPENGESVGVLTGQTLSEVVTQLTLRTFHTSGSSDSEQTYIRRCDDFKSLNIVEYGEYRLVTLDYYSTKPIQYFIHSDNIIVSNNYDTIGSTILVISKSSSDVGSKFEIIDSIFESRTPKLKVILAEISGMLELESITDDIITKTNPNGLLSVERSQFISLKITSDNGDIHRFSLPFTHELITKLGTKVEKGDELTIGSIDVKDYYRINGYEKTLAKMVDVVKSVYHSEGILINSKYIELVLSRTIKKVVANGNEYVEFKGITSLGVSRSMIQHLSLGWFKKCMNSILSEYRLGEDPVDKIPLGIYSLADEYVCSTDESDISDNL